MVNLIPTKETNNHIQTYEQDYPNNSFRASPKRFWLSLRRLALLLSRAIERLWGSTEVIQHQPCFTLS
jgi:hypothetical protein